jgi:hypothetical protein
MPEFQPKSSSSHEERGKIVAILCLSLLQLAFEFLIMKVARYQFGTLSIGVVAVALLGVAAASLSIRLFRSSDRAITMAVIALPCLAWLCLAVQNAQGFGPPTDHFGNDISFTNLLVVGFLAFVVLAVTSVPLFAYIRANVANVHRYYAASFLGGALGIPITYGLLEVAGDVSTGSVLLLLTIFPSLLLGRNFRIRAVAAGLSLTAAATSAPVFKHLDRVSHPGAIYSESDALARIDVYLYPGLRVLGPIVAGDPSFDERMALDFRQAGKGGSTRASPVSLEGSAEILKREIRFLPWMLWPKKAVVIGSGGGIEMLGAIRSGASEIHAIEIDSKVVDYMNRFAPATHNPYANVRVRTHVGEGREISAQIERSEGAVFDLVYIPTAVLRGQSGQVFAQNHLVTEEALYQYLGMLNPTGVLAVNFPLPGGLRQRVAGAMGRALVRRGVTDPESHILVFESPSRTRTGVQWFVLGRAGTPFTDADIKRFLEGRDNVNVVDVARDLETAQDLRPFNDDNPFLFPQTMVPRREGSVGSGSVGSGSVGSGSVGSGSVGSGSVGSGSVGSGFSLDWNRASVTLILAAAVLLILGIFAFAMRPSGAGSRTPRPGYLACFTAIGFAYVVFQSLMIQRLSFLVGHPTLASAFILMTALVASGAGSWLSGRALAADRSVNRAIGTALLVIWIIALSLTRAETLIAPTLSLAWKMLAGIALCAPPFIIMGTYFAVTLKRAEADAPGCITWGWGLNGIASIAGWAFMVGGSMSHGITFVGLCAALIYSAVGVWEYVTSTAVILKGIRPFVHRLFAALVLFGMVSSVWLCW